MGTLASIDTYINNAEPDKSFGLEITECLFWMGYIKMAVCSRPRGSVWDTGRKSEPAFMEMNLKAVRNNPGPGEPRAVVYQYSEYHPMEPRTLLMAYEEHGHVLPVVADFDC